MSDLKNKTSSRTIQVVIFYTLFFTANADNDLLIRLDSFRSTYKQLPRFWINSGFSPPAPLPINNTVVAQELLNKDVRMNIEYLAALPNVGISHVRIHWLLSLVRFTGFRDHKIPEYDFTDMDAFMDHLMQVKIFPVIELMGNIFPQNKFHDMRYMWKDLVYQLVSHYLSRYGQWNLGKWKFELWNEPDLKNYNIFNFTFSDYMEYVSGVVDGLEAAARRTNPKIRFQLRGPAGLFKTMEKHPLCWGLLEYCNFNSSACPVDVITFHRKGVNSASDILFDSIDLVQRIDGFYPNLKHLPYSNTEADPTSGWSKNVSSYADVHYAHTLISIVFEHWGALSNGKLARLESISHDNAFLSYHPYEFEQRTMLARFSMNDTIPWTFQFIQKPVYAAMGMLSALATKATDMINSKNVTYVLSMGQNYAAILLVSDAGAADEINLKLDITKWKSEPKQFEYAYMAEYLHQNQTDPFSKWLKYGRPPYPNDTVTTQMLQAQGPHILKNPETLSGRSTLIELSVKFRHPWVILVRVCTSFILKPKKVKNVRIRSVDKTKILIFWNDYDYPAFERCVRTYEIYYAPIPSIQSLTNGTQAVDMRKLLQWKLITSNKHVPFLSFCHHIQSHSESLEGFYRVRAVDVFDRFGEFSKIHKYQH